jgi:hypothetical protein
VFEAVNSQMIILKMEIEFTEGFGGQISLVFHIVTLFFKVQHSFADKQNKNMLENPSIKYASRNSNYVRQIF